MPYLGLISTSPRSLTSLRTQVNRLLVKRMTVAQASSQHSRPTCIWTMKGRSKLLITPSPHEKNCFEEIEPFKVEIPSL